MLYTCVARSIYYFIIAIRIVFFSTRYAVTRESRNLERSGVTVHFAEALGGQKVAATFCPSKPKISQNGKPTQKINTASTLLYVV